MPDLATKYRITADQFVRMAETGVIPPDARVELLDGEIIEMTPIGTRHSAAVSGLNRAFGPLWGPTVLRVQSPIRLDARCLPEPDFVLATPRADLYASADPTPSDALLVVEVADSSLPYDREKKAPLYARHDIAEYWIVNLIENRIEVHRRPEDGEWREKFVRIPGETLAPLAFPDHAVNVGDLMP